MRDEQLKKDHDNLSAQLRIAEDLLATEKLQHQQRITDLQQTIILNHLHNAVSTASTESESAQSPELTFIDLMDPESQRILKEQCKISKDRINTFKQQQSELMEERKRIDALSRDNNEYLMVIADLNDSIDEYKHIVQFATDKVVELENTIKLKSLEISHISQNRDEIKSKLSSLEHEHTNLKSTLSERHQKYEELMAKYTKIESDLATMTSKHEYLQQSTDQSSAQNQRELSDLKLRMKEMETTITLKTKMVDDLQSEMEQKSKSHQEIVHEYKGKLSALNLQNSNKTKEIVLLNQHQQSQSQSWSETKQMMSKQQHDLTKQLETKSIEFNTLKKQFDDLRAEHAQNAQISQTEMDQIQQTHRDLVAEHISKCQELETLQRRFDDESTSYQQQIESMKKEMDHLVNDQIANLQTEADQYRAEISKLKERIRSMEGVISTKVQEHKSAELRVTKLEEEKQTMIVEMKDISETLTQKESIIIEFQNTVKCKEQEITSQCCQLKQVR